MAKPHLRTRARPEHAVEPAADTDTDASTRGLLRLSLDLHDGPMQDLVAVGFALERLRRDIQSLPLESSALCMQVEGIRDQLSDVEIVLRGLAGAQSDRARETTLVSLLGEEVGRFQRLGGSQVSLDVDATVETATDSQRIALQRILREALTNIAKHAHATRVVVRLYEEHDVIYLQVSDDGVGFDPDAARDAQESGMGLNGMHDRLRLLGSTLRVESRPGGPSTITAAVRRWRPQ